MLTQLRTTWFSNVRGDVLAGMTVALALIPESIAFSVIAKVDPMVGLHTSFCIAVLISIFGGRPGMISASTGAMSLLMVGLVANHGIEYLFAATVLTGLIQFLFGVMKFGRFISFVPQSVVYGFVNALGILIFTAQLQHFVGSSWVMYAIVAATLVIVYVLPRFTTVLPSPLVAIVVMTAVTMMAGLHLKTVGDMGTISAQLPMFHLPNIGWTWDTLMIILPTSLTMAVVGLLESLMTSTIVDEATGTKGNSNKEVRGQGIANFVTGLFGGMAGCGMIGQSIINVKSGGKGRLSTMVAGAFLLFLIIVLRDIVIDIPMAALVGVMIMVAIGTFNWQSIREMRNVPLSDSIVMIVTVVVVLYTHNLALGVLIGVVMSAVIFGWKMSKINASTTIQKEGEKCYAIEGQLFFGTMNHFGELFNVEEDPDHIVIDFTLSHVWDQSAVTAISKLVNKYEEQKKTVTLLGLNKESQHIVDSVGITTSSGH